MTELGERTQSVGLFERVRELRSRVENRRKKKKETKEWKKLYPTTPEIMIEYVYDFVKWQKKEKVDLKKILETMGNLTRGIMIDVALVGRSGSVCWNFSRKLRDVYNFTFQQLSLDYQAYLVSGSFGPNRGGSGHFWVGVLPKINRNEEITAAEIESGATYIDGTVDQYQNWSALSPYHRALFSKTKLLILSPDRQKEKQNWYHEPSISPVPPIWFVLGEKKIAS